VPVLIEEYIDERGVSPFRAWFDRLDFNVAGRVQRALDRLAEGNASALKALGHGLHEIRIDTGPGYRIYLARDRSTKAIILGGGTKRGQQREIVKCVERWENFKARRAGTR
jgi:putative addiction module killer protein